MMKNAGACWLLALALAACGGDSPQKTEVTVFAAASLRDVMAEVGAGFEAASGVHPVFNFAGSDVLAQQVKAAPVADVFLSASERWMDEVEKAGRLVPGSRRVFLSNRLVIVAHVSSAFELASPADLAALEFRVLSLADPRGVPAGQYARQFLETVATPEGNLWQRLEPKVVPALDVRAALALVEAEPAALGIVYRTDAAVSKKVRVLYEVPAELSPEIRYAGAAVAGSPSPAAAGQFLDFLAGPEATAIFERHGFLLLGTGAGG